MLMNGLCLLGNSILCDCQVNDKSCSFLTKQQTNNVLILQKKRQGNALSLQYGILLYYIIL